MDCSYRRILIGLIISALIFIIIIVQCDNNLHATSSSCPAIASHLLPSFKKVDLAKQGHTDVKASNKETLHRRLPDAVIIGAKKAGTRALIKFLRLHPNVSAADPEIHFFDNNFDKGYNWYVEKMPLSKSYQIVIEKTPKYLITENAPQNMYKMNPHVKLLVILRDPVRRAISDYTQGCTKRPSGKKCKKFKQRIMLHDGKTVRKDSPLINIGIYVDHIKRWLEVFQRDQIHFVSGEGLVQNPGNELLEVQHFLGLSIQIDQNTFIYSKNKTFYCIKDTVKGRHRPTCLNSQKGRKHAAVDEDIVKNLYNFYKPYNQKLYQLIGKKFDWKYR